MQKNENLQDACGKNHNLFNTAKIVYIVSLYFVHFADTIAEWSAVVSS